MVDSIGGSEDGIYANTACKVSVITDMLGSEATCFLKSKYRTGDPRSSTDTRFLIRPVSYDLLIIIL